MPLNSIIKNLTLATSVGVLSLVSGCKTNPPALIVYPLSQQSQFDRTSLSKDAVVFGTSVEPEMRFDFDGAYEKSKRIEYKKEPPLVDYMQSPDETERLGTGDCEDIAMYLSKQLTDSNIKNNVAVGRCHIKFGLELHVWNRVIENGKVFVLDSTNKMRVLESEIPKNAYQIYHIIQPNGYSWLDMRKYNLESKVNTIPKGIGNVLTGE